MKIGFATCAEKPEINGADQLAANAVKDLLGCDVLGVPWNSPNAPQVDALVIRSTWDYHYELANFEKWLKQLRCKVFNPLPLLLQNLNKTYLQDFEKAGVPVVPTIFFKDADSLLDQLANRRWRDLVLKPAVSASSHLTFRLKDTELFNSNAISKILERSEGLAQPFVKEIVDAGEVSAIFHKAKGKKPVLSHALRKMAKAGDFRVQAEYGGRTEPFRLDEENADFCFEVLDQIEGEWLYARVDFVDTRGGALLCELELVEPYLFYDQPGADLKGFAEALKSHL